MHPHIALLVKVELEKLLSVGFIRAIDYAEWIFNIVPISKHDKSIRVRIDFRDLNKACPKDDFPLPNIDMIVDMTVGYEIYSLMDGFSGYNQNKIAPEDQEKTTFTCACRTYCWNIMPFGLKNAGATYQRAMTTIFHDMMHKNMEDCVDDTLAKSKKRNTHLGDLEVILDHMEQFQLRLNPKKCAFGVTSEKILGFIILAKGIEVDPEKVQAILDMSPPKNISQMRSLQGCLQSIRRFISQLANRAQPFNKTLHKGVKCVWNEDCQQSMDQIKKYLANPPILMPPIPGKSLILYVSTTESSLGEILAQLDDILKERAIYYISHTLVSYEVNYTSIEKSCLAVVFASQKLRHYMLAHTIHLIAKIDPLKYLLGKAALMGRLAKWMMILSKFDIEYIERKAIKGQVIIDQLADFPIQDIMPIQVEFLDEHIMNMTARTWKMFFDGSFMQNGSGAGVLFVSPHRYTIPKSYKLLFPCTNNIAEYEALTNGLKMAI